MTAKSKKLKAGKAIPKMGVAPLLPRFLREGGLRRLLQSAVNACRTSPVSRAALSAFHHVQLLSPDANRDGRDGRDRIAMDCAEARSECRARGESPSSRQERGKDGATS